MLSQFQGDSRMGATSRDREPRSLGRTPLRLALHDTKSLPAPEFTLLVVVCHCYITFAERVGRLQLQVLYTSTFKCILTWSNNVTLVLAPISHPFWLKDSSFGKYSIVNIFFLCRNDSILIKGLYLPARTAEEQLHQNNFSK